MRLECTRTVLHNLTIEKKNHISDAFKCINTGLHSLKDPII